MCDCRARFSYILLLSTRLVWKDMKEKTHFEYSKAIQEENISTKRLPFLDVKRADDVKCSRASLSPFLSVLSSKKGSTRPRARREKSNPASGWLYRLLWWRTEQLLSLSPQPRLLSVHVSCLSRPFFATLAKTWKSRIFVTYTEDQ